MKSFRLKSLKLVLKDPVDNKTVLIEVMAWCQTGSRPLPESVISLCEIQTFHNQQSFVQEPSWLILKTSSFPSE